MSEEHLSFDDLSLLAEGKSDERADAHLSRCDACRSDLLLLQRMNLAVSDDEDRTHGEADDQRADQSGSEATRQAIIEFAQRIHAEDEAARALLDPLLSGGQVALGIGRRGAKYRTGGSARRLCAAAREALADNPLRALTLADEAIEIAMGLADDLYPGSHVELLRGNAWKERANALRYQGESYDAALDAVDNAERAYRQLPAPDFYLATCNYVRATIFFRMDRYDDALTYSRRAGETFVTFRDFGRYAHARSIEGNVLFDVGRYAEARMVFEQLLAGAEEMSDLRAAAGFAINLAAAEVELGMLDRARDRIVTTLQRCTQFGLETDAIHARRIMGRIPLHAGKPADAAEQLSRVMNECRARGMTGTATRVALDLAEAYAAIPRPADVVRLCSSLIADFLDRGQLTSAMTAFAFLRDAAAAGHVTPAQVKHVKRFIELLDRHPGLLFAPPP